MKAIAVRLAVAVVTFFAGTLANLVLRPSPAVKNVQQTITRVEPRTAPPQPSCAAALKSYLDRRDASAYERTRQADELSDRECYGAAVALLEDAIRLDPSYSAAYGDLGYLYNSLSRFEDAETILKKGVALAPDDTFINTELAYALNASYKPSEAIAPLTRVGRLEPDDAYSRASLSDSYLQLGQRERAVALAREAVKLGAESMDEPALDNAALTLVDLGHSAEAEESVRHALEVAPESLFAHYTLGVIQTATGRSDAAAESFRQVVASRASTPYEHLMRAWAQLYTGDPWGANCEARRYLELVEWKGENVAHAGVVAYLALRRTGRNEEARRTLEEVAAYTNPSSFDGQMLKCLRGELPAEALLSKASNRDELSVAHSYVGLKQSLDGDSEHAASNLEWVKTKGSKLLTAYPFSLQEEANIWEFDEHANVVPH